MEYDYLMIYCTYSNVMDRIPEERKGVVRQYIDSHYDEIDKHFKERILGGKDLWDFYKTNVSKYYSICYSLRNYIDESFRVEKCVKFLFPDKYDNYSSDFEFQPTLKFIRTYLEEVEEIIKSSEEKTEDIDLEFLNLQVRKCREFILGCYFNYAITFWDGPFFRTYMSQIQKYYASVMKVEEFSDLDRISYAIARARIQYFLDKVSKFDLGTDVVGLWSRIENNLSDIELVSEWAISTWGKEYEKSKIAEMIFEGSNKEHILDEAKKFKEYRLRVQDCPAATITEMLELRLQEEGRHLADILSVEVPTIDDGFTI